MNARFKRAHQRQGASVGGSMREVRDIYQRWLDGDLSQEDALFAIGDVLDEKPEESGLSERVQDRWPQVRKKGS